MTPRCIQIYPHFLMGLCASLFFLVSSPLSAQKMTQSEFDRIFSSLKIEPPSHLDYSPANVEKLAKAAGLKTKMVKPDLNFSTPLAACYLIDPVYRNILDFNASGINYYVKKTRWRAGGGWPLYTHPAPRGCISGPRGWPYSGIAGRHNLVLHAGGRTDGICGTSGSIGGRIETEVFAVVNDDIYPDNDGLIDPDDPNNAGFMLCITNWW